MDLNQFIRNQTHVSTTLTNTILTNKSNNSNIVFSPLSIRVILGLIATGSKGQTLNHLLAFFKTNTIDDLNAYSSQIVSWVLADGSPNGGPRLSFANGVWVEQTLSLNPSFKQVADSMFNAVTSQVDFKTNAADVAKEVNLWAENQTNGLIKDLLPAGAVNNLTRLIFANAIFFKGVWSEEFDPSKTKDFDFHLLDGTKVQVPFMTTKKKQLVREYDGFKVLGLPYFQGQDKRQFTMYIYLPDTKDGLPSTIEKIGSKFDFFESHIPSEKVQVGRLLIPKFKIAFGFETSDMLKELGLVLPFSGEEGLTDIVDSVMGQDVYVSSIYHKSFVEVNEEGTEAAAASAYAEAFRSRADPYIDFVADHPFLFVIRDDISGVVLFIGQVTDPRVT